ncbi:MAG: hypothetical protein AAF316_00075 [Cyanobacteria bacterium P01_A01_bin.80]
MESTFQNPILKMPKRLDLTGQRFSQLVVLYRAYGITNHRQEIYWNCQCDCGNTTRVTTKNLRSGNTKSCGCAVKRNNFKHGHTKDYMVSDTYKSWIDMVSRCHNNNHPSYKIYGGRGIQVCPEWRDFRNFLKDMGERPEGMFLERIDTCQGYSPNNCKWFYLKKQMPKCRNKKSGYVGVTQYGTTKKWQSKITVEGKQRYLGYFDTPQEALKARNDFIISKKLEDKYIVQEV